MVTYSFYEELEFDLASKLLEVIVELFNKMPSAQLSPENTKGVDESQGVYQLFRRGELVYIGKTDSESGLSSRLQRHSKKIQWRRNLSVDDVYFKAIRLYVFTPMDIEQLLIGHYKNNKKTNLLWQNSGFGSNDPGRERDTTKIKDSNFDAMYPIDLNVHIDLPTTDPSAADVLSHLKNLVPYNIRYAVKGHWSKPHDELTNARLKIKSGSHSVLQVLREVKKALGAEWQITALPGYVIIYKEKNRIYPSGAVIE